MPTGIYERKPLSEKTKRKMSETAIAVGTGKWMLGRKLSEETKRKISKARKGMHLSEETRKKMSKNNARFFLGKTFSEEHKRKKSKPWSGVRIQAEIKRKGYLRKPIIKNGKEYSPEWNEIRKQIYKKDNWTCRECGIHCQDKKYKKNRIQCHHIDYNEKNNDPNNLITLCASCHGKTNFNKKDWIEYYQSKKRRNYYVDNQRRN